MGNARGPPHQTRSAKLLNGFWGPLGKIPLGQPLRVKELISGCP